MSASTNMPANMTMVSRKKSRIEYHSTTSTLKRKTALMSNQSSVQDKGESECLSIIANMNENSIEAATNPSGINKDDIHFDLSQHSNISTHSGPLTKTMPNKDSNVLPAPRNRTIACFLCGQKGHGQFKCPRILDYGSFHYQRETEILDSL